MSSLAAVPEPDPVEVLAPIDLPDTALTRALHKAMGHPLRLQSLQYIAASEKGVSPRMLADILDAPLGNVSYHVRTLGEEKLIKLHKKVPRRGAIEHYYIVTPRGEKVLEHLKRLAA